MAANGSACTFDSSYLERESAVRALSPAQPSESEAQRSRPGGRRADPREGQDARERGIGWGQADSSAWIHPIRFLLVMPGAGRGLGREPGLETILQLASARGGPFWRPFAVCPSASASRHATPRGATQARIPARGTGAHEEAPGGASRSLEPDAGVGSVAAQPHPSPGAARARDRERDPHGSVNPPERLRELWEAPGDTQSRLDSHATVSAPT